MRDHPAAPSSWRTNRSTVSHRPTGAVTSSRPPRATRTPPTRWLPPLEATNRWPGSWPSTRPSGTASFSSGCTSMPPTSLNIRCTTRCSTSKSRGARGTRWTAGRSTAMPASPNPSRPCCSPPPSSRPRPAPPLRRQPRDGAQRRPAARRPRRRAQAPRQRWARLHRRRRPRRRASLPLRARITRANGSLSARSPRSLCWSSSSLPAPGRAASGAGGARNASDPTEDSTPTEGKDADRVPVPSTKGTTQ